MDNDIVELGLWAVAIVVGLIVLRFLLRSCVHVLEIFYYMFFRALSFLFSFLNGLQRHLSKPWRALYKKHHGSDGINKFMRGFWTIIKIPLYVVLTPLRFVNAVFYNIVVHSSFEFFNYLSEIFDPTSKKEGGSNFVTWTLLMPLRIIKYGWHYLLSLVECIIWTIIDTIIPALTLYHGTSHEASESICQSPGRIGAKDWYSGVWNVGGGNFAGNGIYFAPVRRTSEHYARCNTNKSLIICRVSLGKVIDLGMAPKYVYNQCGSSNALEATNWGLKNGYTTGEWWRSDEGWWEYCMYDWQNRYNSSWRIRPLYVEDLNNNLILRIPGGMAHWLFRKMVIKDLKESIFGK